MPFSAPEFGVSQALERSRELTVRAHAMSGATTDARGRGLATVAFRRSLYTAGWRALASRRRLTPPPEATLPTRPRSLTPDTSGASKKDILELTERLNVRFMRLQFTDILGINKNVEIPSSQFEKALEGDIMFDGSSIEIGRAHV